MEDAIKYFLGLEIQQKVDKGAIYLRQKTQHQSQRNLVCSAADQQLDHDFKAECSVEKCDKVNATFINQFSYVLGSWQTGYEKAATHILHYLSGTIYLGIKYRRTGVDIKYYYICKK